MTQTKHKEAVFADNDKFENDLGRTIKAEEININGKEIVTGEDSTSELEIKILNGQNLPVIDEEIKSLSKSLAQVAKSNLKDADQFDRYKINFVTQLGSAVKVTKTVSYTYLANELQMPSLNVKTW